MIRADFPDPRTPFSVLDVGTGAGDIPRAVAQWARGNGRTAHIWAIDLHSDVLRFATETGPRPAALGFARANAHQLPVRPAGVDYVLASLETLAHLAAGYAIPAAVHLGALKKLVPFPHL